MSTITHIDADKLRNQRQKFGCQARSDETLYVAWHTECADCMAALQRVMTLPGLIFITHGSGYWCDVHQAVHRCADQGPLT